MMANSSEEEIDIGGYDEEPEAQSMELQAENYIGQQDSDVDITQNDEDRQETESGDDDEVEGVYDASNASEGSSEDEDSREHENNEVGIVFDREKDEEDEELLALPPHGTQIFIANLSREVTEEDLRNLCRVCGEVVDITIDWEENTQRTHAFVTFTSKRVADRAIRELNGRVCKDREIRVLKHQAKNRLFLGNIPSHLKEEDVAKRVSEQGPGFEHIQLIKGADDSSRNRRFGFADYYNHACAEKSMKNMIRSQFMLEGKVITVQWAKNNGSSERMKQVHVSNLPENVTEEQMRELFSPHGEITKVLLFPLKNYGFVHFAEHPSALKAIDKSEKYVIEGHELIASMARQKGERKPPSQQSMGHYSYPSRIPNYTHYGQSQQSMGHYSYPSQMPNYPYYVYGANNAYESTRLDNAPLKEIIQLDQVEKEDLITGLIKEIIQLDQVEIEDLKAVLLKEITQLDQVEIEDLFTVLLKEITQLDQVEIEDLITVLLKEIIQLEQMEKEDLITVLLKQIIQLDQLEKEDLIAILLKEVQGIMVQENQVGMMRDRQEADVLVPTDLFKSEVRYKGFNFSAAKLCLINVK
ncbi:hypothetical protein SUGI_0013450 [Cryptomeria japonica]|nr:hypothetical protein SUGI_0013450 [Cryptomeria japonica]